jgi:microsomal dipeptidase-like Zn-dependent dipeptidase
MSRFSVFCFGTALALAGCQTPRPAAVSSDVFSLVNGCFSLEANAPGKSQGNLLAQIEEGASFGFKEKDLAASSRFFLRATDLGTYLLRDEEGRYLFGAENNNLGRVEELESDVTRNEDRFISPAEWEVLAIDGSTERFHLRNLSSKKFLGRFALVEGIENAAEISFYTAEGCSEFPELPLDAEGTITKTTFDDGVLFGYVDAHSHLFTNHAFGGGGVSHGAPFHRLGVEHALSSCAKFHGNDGSRDVVGHFFSQAEIDIDKVTAALVSGSIGEFDHNPEGFPQFTDWPNSIKRPTHQMQYYRWVERAYMSGLRLVVQHATSNQVLCELTTGARSQELRTTCNEMDNAERIFEETRALERYIDAQHGGPGRGWFRVVETPAAARAVIAEGKLAVILGIETSSLFNCFLTPREGIPQCTPESIRRDLDKFQALGVRALFPVHKFDNAFSAGDGHRGFIELGNFVNSGHFGNFTTENCPDVPAVFDRGDVLFGGLNAPRDVYNSPAPNDMSGFVKSPLNTLLPFADIFGQPSIPGDHCQNAGLQPLGEFLIKEMMQRGMIIEVDHLPRRAYARAYELLNRFDYPAAGTHGSDNRGNLYELGGISTLNIDRCIDPADPQGPINRLRARIQSIADAGSFPAQGFSFDFNGFAQGPRPRFGPESGCSTPQQNGISYPFTSFAGDITFQAPQLGERSVSFDNEGMIHLGLLPELLQDARNVGYSEADLEPVFRSAEGYLRMWERAEERAAELRLLGL